jgi:hypothetical protein
MTRRAFSWITKASIDQALCADFTEILLDFERRRAYSDRR